ncbi:MAG: FHA domain-containing protein [Butyrivibrio sp.]|nr:FHA domain-containing protein [Butyrivibrio sp.]
MEYKYYKDLKHSYMIASCNDVSEEELCGYKLKIAENGRIKKLLPVSLRKIDCEQLLYYEVSSMVSLEDRFSSKGMEAEDIRNLLRDMKEMLENLSEYLLGDEGILFDPENIYMSMSSGEYKFMYYPFKGEEKTFAEFAEKLLDLTDHDDEEAIEISYNLCELSKEEGLLLPQLIDEALKTEQVCEEVHAISEKNYVEDDEFEYDDYDDSEEEEHSKVRVRHVGKGFEAKIKFVFVFLFAGVVAAVMYLRMNYVLSEAENLLSIGVILISGVTGGVALLTGIKDMKKAKNESGGRDSVYEEDEYDDDDYYEEAHPYRDFEESYRTPLRITSSEKEIKRSDASEETTVLAEEDSGEMTLYSRNAEKTFRIPLDKLPITIGKLEGYVDTVIKDMSISRIHCRFSREGEKIVVSDLGSTNGTYKNGLKLGPKVKVPIEEGDEIKIGRICFDLR